MAGRTRSYDVRHVSRRAQSIMPNAPRRQRSALDRPDSNSNDELNNDRRREALHKFAIIGTQ